MEFKKSSHRRTGQHTSRPPLRSGPSPSRPHPTTPPVRTHVNPPTASTQASSSDYTFSSRYLRKNVIIGIIIALCVATLTIGMLLQKHNSTRNNASAHDSARTAKELEKQTLSPDGKTAKELGGWKRVSPPSSDPVFAYADTISGVSISVSQQALPKAFKDNTDGHISDLAKKFNATDKLPIKDLTVYIGTSSKGPQSVIFTKNGLLILIKSQQKISDKEWVSYIESLR